MFYNLYLQILFRPFLNALILIYNLMPLYKDMGVALIIFVVILRVILSPLRRKAKASEPDQERVMAELLKAEERYKDEPIKLKQVKHAIVKKHKGTVNLRLIDLLIEGIYFAMLWRIFGEGFTEHELSLLYSFISMPVQPMNLTFLHLFDLTAPHLALNTISAVGLFVVLFFHNWTKPQKTTREDYVLMIFSPFAAYFITYRIPAGQEFFFTITETIEFLLILNELMEKWRKKLGFTEPLLDGKAFIKSFIKTAVSQVSGR
jgi:membrane protein insertase Oxa1/YidC/SpoIIIJ